ncbi:MAG: hypothetical protein BGO63_12380 [Candidatus Accumulibacter sp. 66-26]|nr:hypothetical protein [Accumulibacter sp.]OJW47384.1 MAG: hypothetical protein BGO63_12380 [Candidatus Accumulibacter sp. 66-26]
MLEFLSELLVRSVFYCTGKTLLLIGSQGRWRGATLRSGKKIAFPAWSAYVGKAGGRRIVSVEGQAMFGAMFYVVLLIGFVARSSG